MQKKHRNNIICLGIIIAAVSVELGCLALRGNAKPRVFVKCDVLANFRRTPFLV